MKRYIGQKDIRCNNRRETEQIGDASMPVSKKQLEANRRNALKATGPKDTSLTRLNALKHGLLSKEVLIKGEDRKALVNLGRRLRLDLAPQGELENVLVDRIVSSVWRLKRAVRMERNYIQVEYQQCHGDDLNLIGGQDDEAWSLLVARELGNSSAWLNLTHYETAIERQIYKALHELMRIQAVRTGQKPIAPLALDVDVTKG